MGKKYIIEMEDTMFHKTGESGPETYLWRAKGFNSLVFDRTGISKLMPYTEPNLERVREDAYERGYRDGVNTIGKAEDKIWEKAYQKGYETGYEDGYNEPGKNQQEAYQRGLNDAWDAAKKIGNMPYGEEERVFGSGGWKFIEKHTAAEAIEKIHAYEQERKEFHVGDEFENGSGKKFVVLKMNGKEIDRYIDSDGKTYLMSTKYTVMRKTGRHFSEIVSVLEQMRGENND